MQSSENIKINIKDKLAVITLCDPSKKNAINGAMYKGITKALETISEDDDVSITVITGTGDYYSSGTNLKDGLGQSLGEMDGALVALSDTLKQVITNYRRFISAFITHKKILVAVVNGPAIGIAVTTLALCDIVYCVDTATFQTPFTRLGMVAEGCSSYTFPRIMGAAKANEMLLFNKKITAKEAYEVGLVSHVYTKDEMDNIVWPDLKKNAMELPLNSLKYSKQMIRKFDEACLHEANRQECERLEERWKSEDCMNAIMSFMTHRSKM
ncbi:hypothetical protein RUM44_002923 [Polyplax serrata]|uniref:Enoyl-CoA delta isomerase 2, mitochondrial n=1 Tax=Polyplax serrata TaxID=468196 RepID=A0ABR1AXH4_POLSC